MEAQPKRKKKKGRRALLLIFVLILLLTGIFFGYVSVYYHADEAALAALRSDGAVTVTQTGTGWFFDGPSESDALIFYPGGKVEETAYAPLLRSLAAGGIDVRLVSMPMRLAVFGIGRAGKIAGAEGYRHCYIGGHSLGGAAAALYAAKRGGLDGVILLAAYPVKPLGEDLAVLSIYGSEDGILNMKKLEEGRKYVPGPYTEKVIEGGNHSGFGSYGEQRGDGEALISAEEQQMRAAELILSWISD